MWTLLWRKNVQKVRENQEIYWVAAPKNSDFLDKIPGVELAISLYVRYVKKFFNAESKKDE